MHEFDALTVVSSDHEENTDTQVAIDMAAKAKARSISLRAHKKLIDLSAAAAACPAAPAAGTEYSPLVHSAPACVAEWLLASAIGQASESP